MASCDNSSSYLRMCLTECWLDLWIKSLSSASAQLPAYAHWSQTHRRTNTHTHTHTDSGDLSPTRTCVPYIAPSWCTSTPYTVVVVYNVPWVNPHKPTDRQMDGWTLPIPLSPCFAKAMRSIIKGNFFNIRSCCQLTTFLVVFSLYPAGTYHTNMCSTYKSPVWSGN